MFHHVTLIRFRPDSPRDAIPATLETARAFEGSIPSVVSMSCGPVEDPDQHGWDMAFEFAFDDVQGFRAFAAHAEHVDFVERHVHPYADVVMSVDYTDPSAAAAPPRDTRSH